MLKFVLSVGIALLAQSGPALAQSDDAAGRDRVAEMVAFIRRASEACPKIPELWGTEALALYMVVEPPISEESIEAKETYVADLRRKIGWVKWCQLYSAEMEEAHVIAEVWTNRQ